MKFIKYIAVVASGMMLATSCTDVFNDTFSDNVEKPNSIAELEYLNAYPTLKEALKGSSSRAVNPNFTLGCGVAVSDYTQQGGIYALTNTNFDMLTAGNAMKYASVVNDKGEMDFGNVKSFVSATQEAGMQIYGHTLCWHSQQNTTWLNSLVADKVTEIEGGDGAKIMSSVIGNADGSAECENLVSRVKGNDDVASPIVSDPERGNVYKCDILADPVDPWDCQFFIKSNQALKAGDNIHVSFWYKTTDSRNIDTQAHGNPGEYHHWACIGSLAATPEWQQHEFTGSVGGEWVGDNGFVSIAFNLSSNAAASTFLVDDVVFEVETAAPAKYDAPLISGGDAADGECANLIARVKGNGDVSAPIVQDATRGAVYKCDILADPVDPWDCQFFIKSNEALQGGEKIKVHFWYRADDTRNFDTQAHGNPGEYHHWACIGTLNATTDWQEHSFEGSVDGAWVGDNGFISIAFNLSSAPGASCFYVDDVTFTIEKSGNTMITPLTPEEKYAAVDGELSRWIKGMMDATEGKVKAWDVVNEPLRDTWGDIPLKNGVEDADPNCFYWQDYLGENYVRNAVKYAREHYAAQEGANPSDLKLFINDYNLEAAYNNNDKCTSLVNWIKKWESDGETKIDGIGSQMHISYSCNPTEQARREEAVVNMLKILAGSGKLVRITELDMGIDDAEGNAMKTADVTLEQSKAMGEYYKFIIEKYFEIIPVDQQFGICQWCITDAPAESGWRGNSPVGLWNLDYQRKPTYGGFADGLMGK
ncbi:MAG: endo-1,4-beta-xylanase [Muribaculaceae bacterium]|nr:endo-1,4-beta-xylanase [Muribaculaceae bacterium]